MPIALRVAAFLVPVFGLPYSLWLRPHSPLAGNQGLVSSIIGAVLYVVAYFGRQML